MTKRYATFHICPSCARIMSIPEQVERFCERCKATVEPKPVREVAA